MPFVKDAFNQDNVVGYLDPKDELYATVDGEHDHYKNENKVSHIRKEVIKSFTAQLNGQITNDNDETDSDTHSSSQSSEPETQNEKGDQNKDENKLNVSKSK